MNEPSPGPWTCIDHGWLSICDRHGLHVTDLDMDTSRADGELIESAPDLAAHVEFLCEEVAELERQRERAIGFILYTTVCPPDYNEEQCEERYYCKKCIRKYLEGK